MAEERDYTNNINLVLPKGTDQYDVVDFNENMQKIDDFAGLVPPKALTADKLTVARNINGVPFDGTKNVITGIGLHSMTETYANKNVVFGFDESNRLVLFRSKQDGNKGHATSESDYWEKINLEALDLDTTNQTKALTTGNVSSNPDVYADILKRAHSTFDKSKFKVVGSPTITEDGVASGFSADNIVKIPDKYFASNLSALDISLLINTQDLSIANQGIFGCKQKENTSMAVLDVKMTNSGGQLVYSTGLGTQKDTTFTAQWLGHGKDKINFKINNSKIELFINEELILTVNDFVYVQPIDFYIGSNRNKADIFQGSIDLKSIAVWADGIPVFNGNKTGLDIIKKDNYEIVGSPTITEDGILSDLSNSNYIKTNINLSSTYRIEIDLDILDTPSVSQLFIDIFRGTKHLKGYIGPSGNLEFFFQDGVSNSYCKSVEPNFNQKNKILFELTQDQAITQCNDSSQTITRDSIPVELILTGECIFYIGKGEVIKSINLNSIKVYSDGNLIYQPCLKIPYIEAGSTSRIVDVAYRGRVQDLYEQTGESLFYTIDEQNQNFTLPMGDIYGMITKNRELSEHANLATAKAYIIETYQNVKNGYVIYSNGLCHQWGYVGYPGGAYAQFDINLLKPFKDTNYFVSAIVTGNASSGDSSTFRLISQSTNKFNVKYVGSGNNSGVVTGGYWQAIGYVNLE